jgi:soluble lytic murein transglycosylase-like protein
VKRWLLAASLATAAGAAPASLWGWVDAQGVAHFASEPADARWLLVLADTGTPRASALRVPGKADGAGALLTWLDISPQVKAVLPWLREAALRHGVDAELLTAVIAVESGFNADAVSPRGAIGLMQITAETGDRYATATERLAPADTRLLDPRTNIQTGARMLADLQRRYARVDVALAAWNAGEGAVRRHGGAMPPIDETRAHVHLVMELYWALLQRSQAQRATSIRLR